jgi:hypothetical protein
MSGDYTAFLACRVAIVASVVPKPGLNDQIRCNSESGTLRIHNFVAVYDAWSRPNRCIVNRSVG